MRAQSALLVLAAVFVSSAIAQNQNDDGDTSSSSSSNASQSSTANDAPKPTSALPDIDQSTSTPTTPTTTTPPSTTTAITSVKSVPSISSDTGSVPPLPSLPGSYSYPPPAVPPTKNAPFMQQSSLPQGTVFIAVGSILGAFAVAILVWRSVVACLLHRSVRRATLAQQVANDKSAYPPPSAPFYKYGDHASSISLGPGPASRGARKSMRGPVPSTTPNQSTLFFSPTAPAGAGNASNRESRFLPSGFYAASGVSPQPGHEHSISLSNLRPDSSGHARTIDPSPPDSPSLLPPHNNVRRNLSSSTLNLNRPTSGRAPSAYLEDLLADQPEQFPPAGHRNTWNQPPNRL